MSNYTARATKTRRARVEDRTYEPLSDDAMQRFIRGTLGEPTTADEESRIANAGFDQKTWNR